MVFDELVDEMIPRESALYGMIQELLTRKKAGDELDIEPRLGLIHEFILERIAYFEQVANGLETAPGNQDQALDEMFRGALREIWGEK